MSKILSGHFQDVGIPMLVPCKSVTPGRRCVFWFIRLTRPAQGVITTRKTSTAIKRGDLSLSSSCLLPSNTADHLITAYSPVAQSSNRQDGFSSHPRRLGHRIRLDSRLGGAHPAADCLEHQRADGEVDETAGSGSKHQHHQRTPHHHRPGPLPCMCNQFCPLHMQ